MARMNGVGRLGGAALGALVALALVASVLAADEEDAASSPTLGPGRGETVYRVPTLGGTVWWVDVWSDCGYRVQTHKISGTHRLLDPANVLVAVGDFEQCQLALARELDTPPEGKPVNANLALPTLGGTQFWGDEFYGRGWRIQRNAITGHYRLLDAAGTRQAWGTYGQCEREHRRLTAAEGARATSGTLVVLLHGIWRSPDSLKELRQRLAEEGYEVFAMAYPSTQADIPAHAAQLNRLLSRLEGVKAIHLVCHSMGGLVARAALQRRPDARVQSMVTLGTPHHGAIEASMLKDWFPYKVVFGPAGQQLVAGSGSFTATLGPPPCRIGCIAGGRSDGEGFSPVIPGDDDDTVETTSALYEKADATLVVKALHSFLMNNDEAIEATVRFLRTGKFQ